MVTRGDNRDTTRRRNLSAILEIAHRRGAASRSELTRVTRLNRSTVASLVSELVARRLVRETEPRVGGGVGRPSPVVEPRGDVAAIAVNPEVDAVTVAVVGLDGSVRGRARHAYGGAPTYARAVEVIVAAVGQAASSIGRDGVVVGVGVAVPGLVRGADGTVIRAPQLEWSDAPLARDLAERTGLPVTVANDANLGVWAEHLFGAGRGIDDVVYVNGGASGIGSGVLAQGRLLVGADGYAGELGHTVVNTAGSRCHCGASGCLETEVTKLSLTRALSLPPSATDDDLVRALSGAVSAEAQRECERQQVFVARALRSAVNVLNPRVVLVGGFLRAVVQWSPGRVAGLMSAESLVGARSTVRIEQAQLGESLMLVGAAELPFAGLIADPTKSDEIRSISG